MNLTEWIAKLRAASNVDLTPVRVAAERAAARATASAGGTYRFMAMSTPTGARVVGFQVGRTGSSPLSPAQVRQLAGRELDRARDEIATDLRARLTP